MKAVGSVLSRFCSYKTQSVLEETVPLDEPKTFCREVWDSHALFTFATKTHCDSSEILEKRKGTPLQRSQPSRMLLPKWELTWGRRRRGVCHSSLEGVTLALLLKNKTKQQNKTKTKTGFNTVVMGWNREIPFGNWY